MNEHGDSQDLRGGSVEISINNDSKEDCGYHRQNKGDKREGSGKCQSALVGELKRMSNFGKIYLRIK